MQLSEEKSTREIPITASHSTSNLMIMSFSILSLMEVWVGVSEIKEHFICEILLVRAISVESSLVLKMNPNLLKYPKQSSSFIYLH